MASFIQLFALATILVLLPLQLYLRSRRLKSVPGPRLASFTDLWRAYAQNYSDFTTTLLQLHHKYGPLVRIGPNSISVSDPAAVSTIYTNHGEFRKVCVIGHEHAHDARSKIRQADSYHPLRVLNSHGKSAGSVLDMQDEDQSTALKRGVGSAFATKNLLDYENDVDDTASELIHKIQGSPLLDLFPITQYFQLDFLTKAAFSENFGHLKTGEDVWGMAGALKHRMAHWQSWQGLPQLERLIFQHPVWSRATKRPARWVEEAMVRLRDRESATAESLPTKKDFLQKYIDGRNKVPAIEHDTLRLMVTSTISAGFDTTALTITTIIFFLTTHPDVCAKLKQELEGVQLSKPVPKWTEVNKLEYLDAVFKEAMRCNPVVTAPLERVVPAGGATITGARIPEGAIVGCLPKVIHQNRELYGDDSDVFRPERWLTAPEKRLAMERALLSFGSGKRICIGRHIVELEIKKLIPALVVRFKVSRSRRTLRDAYADEIGTR